MDSKPVMTSAEKSARYRQRHPERVKAAQKKWREANPEKVKARNERGNRARTPEQHREYMREWRKLQPEKAKSVDLKKRFGIGIDEYRAKEAAQGGMCAACGNPPGARALAVDHDHDTGVIRDLLCDRCNTSIGLMGESPERLLGLIEYLRKWGK